MATAYKLRKERGWHSPVCRIHVSIEKEEVQRQLLTCATTYPFSNHPRKHWRLPLGSEMQQTQWSLPRRGEVESAEGGFRWLYGRQGKGAAQHWLFLLVLFFRRAASNRAARASNEMARLSEKEATVLQTAVHSFNAAVSTRYFWNVFSPDSPISGSSSCLNLATLKVCGRDRAASIKSSREEG